MDHLLPSHHHWALESKSDFREDADEVSNSLPSDHLSPSIPDPDLYCVLRRRVLNPSPPLLHTSLLNQIYSAPSSIDDSTCDSESAGTPVNDCRTSEAQDPATFALAAHSLRQASPPFPQIMNLDSNLRGRLPSLQTHELLRLSGATSARSINRHSEDYGQRDDSKISLLGTYPCNSCARLFRREIDLRRHEEAFQVKSPQTLGCGECIYHYPRQDEVMVHFRKRNGGLYTPSPIPMPAFNQWLPTDRAVLTLHQRVPPVFDVIDHVVRHIGANRLPLQLNFESELRDFIVGQLAGDHDLSDVLVITGDCEEAYVTTCAQYVMTTWGKVGMRVFQAVNSLYNLGDVDDSMFRIRHIKTSSSRTVYEMQIKEGSISDLIATVQTTAWLTAVFRNPAEGPPHTSEILLSYIAPHKMDLTLDSLQPPSPKASASCWYGLLPNTSIAVGFPIPSRDIAGLHLSFDLMLELADVISQTKLSNHGIDFPSDVDTSRQEEANDEMNNGGIFYNGVGTLLYPVRLIHENKRFMLWHLEKSTGSTLPTSEWLRVPEDVDFSQFQHILGFTAEAEIHLGTKDRIQSYSQMKHTSISVEQDRLGISLANVSLTLGRPPVQFVLGGSIKYTKGQRVIANSEQRRYHQILRAAELQPIILYDSGVEMGGWLVSQLSVILDLVNYYVHLRMQKTIPSYAPLHADGGAVAAVLLSRREIADWTLAEDGDDVKVKDLVKDIYVAMSKRATSEELAKQKSQLSRFFQHERIYGWDLLELVEPCRLSRRRELQIHNTQSKAVAVYPSWMRLTETLPVYFCDDLGQVITSSHSDGFGRTLRGRKTLTASLRALYHATQNKPQCKDLHLNCGLIWELPGCEVADASFINLHCTEHVRKVKQHEMQTFQDSHNCRPNTDELSSYMDSAISFGPKESRLVRLFANKSETIAVAANFAGRSV